VFCVYQSIFVGCKKTESQINELVANYFNNNIPGTFCNFIEALKKTTLYAIIKNLRHLFEFLQTIK